MSLPNLSPEMTGPIVVPPGEMLHGPAPRVAPLPDPPLFAAVAAGEPPAFFPTRMRTWTLPNGRFVLVFDRAPWADGPQDADEDERMTRLRDSTGAAAVLAYADEVDLLDADVLVDDVPAGVRAEDERLVAHLREFASSQLSDMRAELDHARHEVVRLRAEHEAATRDLAETLERMRRTRELARAHGYSTIVEALTLPDGDAEGDVAPVEAGRVAA